MLTHLWLPPQIAIYKKLLSQSQMTLVTIDEASLLKTVTAAPLPLKLWLLIFLLPPAKDHLLKKYFLGELPRSSTFVKILTATPAQYLLTILALSEIHA